VSVLAFVAVGFHAAKAAQFRLALSRAGPELCDPFFLHFFGNGAEFEVFHEVASVKSLPRGRG
jgi:hypothetical protein